MKMKLELVGNTLACDDDRQDQDLASYDGEVVCQGAAQGGPVLSLEPFRVAKQSGTW